MVNYEVLPDAQGSIVRHSNTTSALVTALFRSVVAALLGPYVAPSGDSLA